MSPNSHKGQASVIDLIVGFTLFTTIFIINYYLWNSIEVKLSNNEKTHSIKSSVLMSVESLIKTQGYPEKWYLNTSNTKGVGLATIPNILSNKKITALNNSYDTLSDLVLPTGDFEITISNSSGTLLKIGKKPIGNVIRVDRIVKINNSYYLFTFRGWTNE